MKKIVEIDGKQVGFKATALTPRLYRHMVGRDMVSDMAKLERAFKKAEALPEDATEEEKRAAQFSVVDLEIFETVAWVMAKQYDSTVPSHPDEWLDEFEIFSIYEVLEKILELWGLNNKTTAEPKKK